MNTPNNPGDHWDGATRTRLRAELARSVTEAMVQRTIAVEAGSRHGHKNNVQYRSTLNAFQDPTAKDDSGTAAAMFLYAKEPFSTRGPVRGLGHPAAGQRPRRGSVFRMSVDAIDPLQGHVRGNLRLIRLFLQAGARDKSKKTADADDGPSQWTPALFRGHRREHRVGYKSM